MEESKITNKKEELAEEAFKFIEFFNDLEKKIKKDEHIHWEKNLDSMRHLLNYLKENKHNFNDIILMGHCLIDLSLEKAINSLEPKDKNIGFIKRFLEDLQIKNNESTNIDRDIMLLISAYLGEPLDEIKVSISDSKFISLNLKKRFNILANNNFKCSYCGRSPPEVKLELEHIFPKSKGGKDVDDNFTTACFQCNSGKRARPISEIMGEKDNGKKMP